jgi:hypothetical protein
MIALLIGLAVVNMVNVRTSSWEANPGRSAS